MGLILATLVGALVVARLLGGRLAALESLPIRGWQLLAGVIAGLWLGTVAGWLDWTPLYWLGLLASAGCALAYCVVNRSVHGMGLVAAGLLANAVVVGVNSGMPVSPGAASRAGLSYAELLDDPRHVPAGPGAHLGWLGDAVPVPLPLRPEVVSLGDLAVAAGLAQLLATAMLRGLADPRRVAPKPARRPRPAREPRPVRTQETRTPVRREPDETGEGVLRVFRPGDGTS